MTAKRYDRHIREGQAAAAALEAHGEQLHAETVRRLCRALVASHQASATHYRAAVELRARLTSRTIPELPPPDIANPL